MKRLFSRRKSSQPTITVDSASTSLPSPRSGSPRPKSRVSSLPHPSPYASIHVLVTEEGLFLRPDIQSAACAVSHVKIHWGKDGAVEEIQGDIGNCAASTLVYGIVGIMRLFHASYLLVITSRTEVGNIFDETRTVFRVDGVSAIPLEQTRAVAAVNILASSHPDHDAQFQSKVKVVQEPIEGSDTCIASDASVGQATRHDNESHHSLHVTFAPGVGGRTPSSLIPNELDAPTPPSSSSSGYSTPTSSLPPSSPVASALAARLSFWSRLSKRADFAASQPDQASLPTAQSENLEHRVENGDKPTDVLHSIIASTAPPPSTMEEKHSELDEKIVRETIKEFVKGGMHFSYNFDITTSLQRKHQRLAKLKRRSTLLSDLQALDEQPPVSLSSEDMDIFSESRSPVPLWRRVDRKFWWNESLLTPFIDAGLHLYVLPIMQGYCQIASFRIPSSLSTDGPLSQRDPGGVDVDDDETAGHLVDYVIVSRRSRERAGLRYQRRGIDEEANVANFVETEAILRVNRDGRSNIFSYIQIRGSIPLFWIQPGYGLKPAPQLSTERTHNQNMDVLERHLARTIPIYGPHTIVNLAEQHGKEGAITTAYRECIQELGSTEARYCEYDFHAETKGMRYENISKLIVNLERTFESQGFFWVSDGMVMSQQRGVFRVNCIDCLDRTNVVQSAFARFVLQGQLEAVAMPTAHEAGDRTDADVVFNDVWANNGDAISRAYAGTSALKGDFTRTGKRDFGGLLNDGLNSLSRVYTSTFSDWFSQAVIDFFLGNRTLSVFSEFLLKLSSSDPRDLIRISKVRAAAIETCSSRVLFEGEKQIGGWTLFSPADVNTKFCDNFEERVLLLTPKALYMVSYDYSLEKVKFFTRIPLGDVVGISKGIYILSPLEEASRSPEDNYGFVISYLPSRLTTRVTSYSVRNTVGTAKSTRPSTSQRQSSGGSTTLSKMLSNMAQLTGLSTGGAVLTAAFKALPVDIVKSAPDVGDPVASATSCRDAVDLMVEIVRKACVDVGSAGPEFVSEKDIISLAEAQRMTSMYAKLEYNFKRLLWLGS